MSKPDRQTPIPPRTLCVFLYAALLTTIVPAASSAQNAPQQERPDDAPISLSPRQTLEAAMQQNPSLRSAVIEMKRADLALRSELYRYVPIFLLDGRAQLGQRPNLSRTGIISIQNQSYRLTPGIEQTFPTGTTVSGELSVDRTVQDSVFLGDLGTTWGTDVTLSVSQPWLRGFGYDVGLAQRKIARAQSAAAIARRNDEASRLARDVMTAYWQLWQAQREVSIQEQALDVAEQTLEDAQVRLDAGAIAPSELIPLRREAASIREALATSRASLVSRRVELARLLGMETQPGKIRAGGDPPETVSVPDPDDAVETARRQSYSLREQEKQIDQAAANAAVARDEKLPRLDTTASLAISGLGRELDPALESLVAADGLIGLFTLDFQLPLINKSRAADAQRAALAVDRARKDYESAEDQVTASVLDQIENLETARKRLDLARETARLSAENVDFQRTRFENGAATALDVAQALQDQREAELRVANQRVELATRRLALDHLTANLLKRLALPSSPIQDSP